MTTIVSARAINTGTPRSMSPTSVRAANSTMTPWAKLNTPEALKIRTKPRATSEYRSPEARPPISTSTRNSGAPAMSANGATSTRSEAHHAAAASRMGDPEVGVEHRWVGCGPASGVPSAIFRP